MTLTFWGDLLTRNMSDDLDLLGDLLTRNMSDDLDLLGGSTDS